MRIQQLKLKNFRGIKNLELNFDTTQSVAILVGINGAGKSSILECISALIRNFGLTIVNGWLNYSFQDRDIHNCEESTSNSIKMLFDSTEISWEVEKRRDTTRNFDRLDNMRLSQENFDQHIESPSVSVFYAANRRSIQIHWSTKIRQVFDDRSQMVVNQTYYEDSLPNELDVIDFIGFTNWFQKLEDLENETRLSTDNNHRDIKLEATRKAIYSMLGDGFSNLRMKRAIDKLTIHKANQEIELDWLSDGERGLLALAGDLARRLATTYPDSANPLHEAGLVLIDEIELHLHPAWQRIIIQRLTQTFPGCQFIVTTHSPQVLSNVQPECIHILAVEDDNVVVKRPERSYGRDSNRILEDIMGVSKRPPEIEARILELFRIIHDGELDRAKDLIQNLATEIGIDEPELIRAASTIHRREVIGR
jgi:predicted ATP-binding protein involved in virulence